MYMEYSDTKGTQSPIRARLCFEGELVPTVQYGFDGSILLVPPVE